MVTLIAACTSQGSHYPCDDQSPRYLVDQLLELVDNHHIIIGESSPKSFDQADKAKNLMAVNAFNQNLYQVVNDQVGMVVTVGGDHSVAIGSGLASLKKHGPLGLIWLDSHSDYHTMHSTESGNLHGLPFATLTGHNRLLSGFHQGGFFDPANCVLIGGRSIDAGEVDNLRQDGVKVFTSAEVMELGVERVVAEALQIALTGTNGLHVSLDLDLLDPQVCPGVSVPEINGLDEATVMGLLGGLMASQQVKSADVVEYNALNDQNHITQDIALKLIKATFNR